MSNNRNLGNIATAITNATSGQVLTSQGNGVATFADAAGGSSVTTVTNVSGASDSLTAISSPDVGDIVFVTSTNGLFIRKSNGWFKIADVTNLQPTNLTGVSDSALAIDGTATTITLSATDPEGLALTFSAAAKTGSSTTFSAALTDGNTVNALNGSTVIATVAQASNVFTITPNTASNSGTIDITFSVTDGINTALTDDGQFTLTFVTIVTDSKYTALLATATGTSDNDNITYIDGSGNSQNFTVTGSVTAGTFSPHRSGGYSMNFGSGASLKFAEASTSNFNMGTNAFTIEMWIRPANTSSGSKRFFHNRISGMANGRGHIFQNGSNLYATYRGDNGTDYELTASGVLTAETWTHVCFLRDTSDNTLKLYYDGTLGQSVSVPSTVGIYNSTSNTNVGLADFGDIANLRVVNGTAITPTSSSIAEIPTNVTNTVLLMTGGNFTDYSGNAPQINNYYGPPEIKAYGPLDYTEYSTTDYGGSVYFDASNYATISNFNQQINGNFTLECWVYVDGSNATDDTFLKWGRLRLRSNNNSEVRDNTNIGGITTTEAGRWIHVVIDRSGNTLKAYKNGINFHHNTSYSASRVGSDGTESSVNGNLYLGWDGSSEKFIGYISDLRIVSESLYGSYGTSTSTSNFTPPTAPLASNSNAILHFKGTDASVIDKSQGTNLKLEGNTTGSTDQVRSGVWANTKTMKFDGNGDYIPVITDFFYEKNTSNASTTAFTIETWVYHTARLTYSGYNHIFQTIVGLGNVGMSFGIGPSGNLKFYHQSGSTNVVTSTSTISLNTWTHIAVIVDGSQGSSGVTLKINGTTDGTGSWSGISTSQSDQSTPYSSPHFTIGRYPDSFQSHQQFQGYLQDLRISSYARTITSAPSAPLEG